MSDQLYVLQSFRNKQYPLFTFQLLSSAFSIEYDTVCFMRFDIVSIIDKTRFYCQVTQDLRDEIEYRIRHDKKKEILDKINVFRTTLKRILELKTYWANLSTLFHLCKILKINEDKIRENILFIKTKNSFPISTKFINFSNEFARIVGHLLGDGGIHIKKNEGKYRIFYANKQKILIKFFYQDLRYIFIDAQIYVRHREKEQRVSEVWLSTTASIILFAIFNMKDCKTRRVPEFVYQWKEDYKGAFLQALFDDEGFIYPKKNLIAMALSNKELLNDIKDILQNLEINSNPIKVTNNKKRTRMFYFYISCRKNILNFSKNVGFLHPIKSDKLKLLVSKYGE